MWAGSYVAIITSLLFAQTFAQQFVVTQFSFSQPQGISSWDTWNFFSAGSFLMPSNWAQATVTWAFDGAIQAWYVGQASMGTASCYAPVSPVSGAVTQNGSCPVTASPTPYAVGLWLWGAASVMGGTWSVTVKYVPVLSPPPPLMPARPPPIGQPPYPQVSPTWTSQGCAVDASGVNCTSRAVGASQLPVDQFASISIPYTNTGTYYLGIFMTQAQSFDNLGFPVPIIITDSQHVYNLWTVDLPNTPSGESCQSAGGDCPNGQLSMPKRPTAVVARIASSIASTVLVGIAPSLFNSWGPSGGSTCAASAGCLAYGPTSNVTIRDTAFLAAAAGSSYAAADDVFVPSQWLGTWSNYTAAFAYGDGQAAALVASACETANATTTLGWFAGGNTTVNGAVTGAQGVSVVLAVGAYQVLTTIGSGVPLPAGPLSVTLRLTAPCQSTDWIRSLVTDVYVAVTYPPAPKSGFVIKQSIGSCIRGMQPLVASV